ncbi:MAG: hypothetical protein ABI947_09650 [Chloroflexota bacterium]
MGVFTEIVLSCRIKRDISKEILHDLAAWCGEIELDPNLPHPFFYETFKYENSTAFTGKRYYSLTDCDDGNDFCFSIHANRKNYEREIEEFLAWIVPHSSTEGFVGYLRSELTRDPQLIFFVSGKAFLRKITAYTEIEAAIKNRVVVKQ